MSEAQEKTESSVLSKVNLEKTASITPVLGCGTQLLLRLLRPLQNLQQEMLSGNMSSVYLYKHYLKPILVIWIMLFFFGISKRLCTNLNPKKNKIKTYSSKKKLCDNIDLFTHTKLTETPSQRSTFQWHRTRWWRCLRPLVWDPSPNKILQSPAGRKPC